MARQSINILLDEKTHLRFLRAYEDRSAVDVENLNLILRDKLDYHTRVKINHYHYTRRENGKYICQIEYEWQI
ncbi:MAG TPA: hypothetical protein VMX35_03590 [Acidobacteriota bacterium]|nr:hypothetical protein [Acidobacteriota bacterium]